MSKLFVYVDGRSEGEPGDAGIGVAITDPQGNVIDEISKLIGRTTSEVAEYRALAEACRYVLTLEPESVIFFTDNQRLANHVNRVFVSREPHIQHLVEEALSLLNRFPQWRVNYVDRYANYRAPGLVDRAFHHGAQVQIVRERLETELLARATVLDEEAMRRLIAYAERLGEERGT
jgi:ribonuclease HI